MVFEAFWKTVVRFFQDDFFILPAAPARARTLKYRFRVEDVSYFALRPFSCAATKRRKRDEQQHRKQPQKARESARKNHFKKRPKMISFGAKMLSKSTPEASEGLSEAAGAPKKQTKARNRKLIGPKNAPRAPGSKKERSQGGGEYARAGWSGVVEGWAGAPGRGRGGVLQQRYSACSNAEKPSEAGSADLPQIGGRHTG